MADDKPQSREQRGGTPPKKTETSGKPVPNDATMDFCLNHGKEFATGLEKIFAAAKPLSELTVLDKTEVVAFQLLRQIPPVWDEAPELIKEQEMGLSLLVERGLAYAKIEYRLRREEFDEATLNIIEREGIDVSEEMPQSCDRIKMWKLTEKGEIALKINSISPKKISEEEVSLMFGESNQRITEKQEALRTPMLQTAIAAREAIAGVDPLAVERPAKHPPDKDKGAEGAGGDKPAELSPGELSKYADEYREIHDSLKNIIARNDVELRHVVMRLARSLDKAGRILLMLMEKDHEGPWHSLSKPDPRMARDNGCFDGGQVWTIHGIAWLREEKPLCFDMKPPEFDPSCIRTDVKGVPLESNMLAVLREQVADHLAGCRAMAEILSDESKRRGAKSVATSSIVDLKAKAFPAPTTVGKLTVGKNGQPAFSHITPKGEILGQTLAIAFPTPLGKAIGVALAADATLKRLDNPWVDDDAHRVALFNVMNRVFVTLSEAQRPSKAVIDDFAAHLSGVCQRLEESDREFSAAVDTAIKGNDADWHDKTGVVLPPWNADKETIKSFWQELAGRVGINFGDVKAAGDNIPCAIGPYIKGKLVAAKQAQFVSGSNSAAFPKKLSWLKYAGVLGTIIALIIGLLLANTLWLRCVCGFSIIALLTGCTLWRIHAYGEGRNFHQKMENSSLIFKIVLVVDVIIIALIFSWGAIRKIWPYDIGV